MNEYQKLKFNVLFKDIYLFYKKAYPFGNFSNDFIDKFYPEMLLSEEDNLMKIIHDADILKSPSLDSNLISIFSKISLDNHNPHECYVPLSKLVLDDSIYPIPFSNSYLDYKSLWDNFVKELELLKKYPNFDNLLSLLKKYTFAICYNDDISLYDHIKITNALANCLYLQKDDYLNKNPFLIINGDLSGIQKFIYKISKAGKSQKGISKRLRGRSLYVTLLTEAISNTIISKLNLDVTNILFCSGGRFTIIAPNTEKNLNILNDLDYEINKSLIDKFNIDLYLVLVNQEVSFEELNDYSGISYTSNRLINKNKKHKFIKHLNYLFNDNNEDEDETDKDQEDNIKLCKICGNEIKDNKDVCDSCKNQELIGKLVANAKYMVIYESYFKSNLNILDFNYNFFDSKEEVTNFVNDNDYESFQVFKLNDTDFTDTVDGIYTTKISFDFKFIGNLIPNINNDSLLFEHLAKISKGSNKLGILKMDVDNLGEIFYKGFNKNFNLNIYRISSLSFFLDIFFLGMINEIANEFRVYTDCGDFKNYFHEFEFEFGENNKKSIYKPYDEFKVPIELEQFAISTIYINYSGGDDLLVLGPYDDIIEFSVLFRDKFKEWTGFNKSINISAGLGIFNYMYSIGYSSIQVNDFLNKSKKCGKDKITIFNQTLSWDDVGDIIGFKEILKFSKKLEKLTEKNLIPSYFVSSLLNIWEKNKGSNISNIVERNIHDEKLWLDFNCKKASVGLFVPKYYNLLGSIEDKIIENKSIKNDLASYFKFIPWVKFPVSWVSLRLWWYNVK